MLTLNRQYRWFTFSARAKGFIVFAVVGSGLVGCGLNGTTLSDADAAQQIQARLESAQWEFFDGSHRPCANTFSIVSVRITDKTVNEKAATVEAEVTMAAKNNLDARAMIENACFGVNWDVPFVIGQRGTWKSRYSFQLWQSGWKLL